MSEETNANAIVPAASSLPAVNPDGSMDLSQIAHGSTPADLKEFLKVGSFLPRVQLMTSRSQTVEEGKFPNKHYALIMRQELTDLGEEVMVVPIAMRPKAIVFAKPNPITYYDKDSAEFKEVVKMSATKDSGRGWGPEFLVWLPSQGQFALLLLLSISAKGETENLHRRLGKAVILGNRPCKGPKYSWTGMNVTNSSEAFTPPSQADLALNVEKFLNPPAFEKDDDMVENPDAKAGAGRET